MKQCPTCQESFADKFAFCPVDGTSLSVDIPAMADEPEAFAAEPAAFSAPASTWEAADSTSAPDAASELPAFDGEETVASGAGAMIPRDEFHLTFLEDTGLVKRLTTELRGVAHESQLTWPEFKRDPGGYSKRFITGYGQLTYKFFSQRNVALATLSSFLLISTVLGGFIFLDMRNTRHRATRQQKVNENLELQAMLDIPAEQEKPDKGTAGTAKGSGGGAKPKQEKAQGGGGGGRQEQTPASFGKLPPARLEQQIIAPTTRPPVNTRPNLPVPMTIVGDRVIMPDDNRPLPYGDPKSKSTEQSDGPGTGLGIGTGDRGGVGSGDGGGYGPGRGGNTGGGDMRLGGGGPGGGGGGGGEDYTRTFRQNEVTRKAVLLAKPEPGFTEEARKNNVTGVVRLQMVLSSSGAVTNIRVVKPLPDGLTEKAIAAARQIRFTPAQKDGRAVSQYVTIEYNFNIY